MYWNNAIVMSTIKKNRHYNLNVRKDFYIIYGSTYILHMIMLIINATYMQVVLAYSDV